jgi:lipid-A-disaccharide synthase
MSTLTVFISTGEVSGDLVGACIAREVFARQPDARIFGVGGRRMAEAGVTLDFGTNHLGTVGITEPLSAIPALTRALWKIRRRVRTDRPAVALLIGNDVFNVLLGRWLRSKSIPTISYLPPQTWIWRSLARPISRSFDLILTSFPAEQQVYSHAGAKAEFVGHYLADILVQPSREERASARRSLGLDANRPVIGLLPGSRFHEVRPLSRVELDAAVRLRGRLHSVQFLLPVADPVFRPFLDREIRRRGLSGDVVLCDDSAAAMRASDLLVAASGTATLEAALLGVPLVIVYKVSAFTMAVVRACIRLGLIERERVGLPNLLAGREFVPELRNRRATAARIETEALSLLLDDSRRHSVEDGLRQVADLVSGRGALRRVAEALLARARPGGKVDVELLAAAGGPRG